MAPATVGAPKHHAVAAYDQNFAKLDDLTELALDLVDLEHIFGGNPVLLAACFEDREHLYSSCSIPACGDQSGPAFSSRILLMVSGVMMDLRPHQAR